ncbi:hypothetical protein [Natrinema hispanicum]|uniref:Uncharacterized protein n=1 Tax=Natrinema hispanicum TaxID=392421 RepID=A0A1G6WUR4_9EURY|nr:hypothetical protein [Natrinema hispanicum]SDD69680.1 hypothetical protein SAMN05192552_104022 [Natrinema hispanicum]
MWIRTVLSEPKSKRQLRPAFVLFLFAGLLLFLQWSFADYFGIVVFKLSTLLAASGSASVYVPEAAVHPGSKITLLLFDKFHAIVLLTLGGISWLYIFLNNPIQNDNDILSLIASLVSLCFIGIVASSAIPITRALFYSEIMLAGLVGGGLVLIHKRLGRKSIILCFLAILLVSQTFSSPALIDSTHQPRYYLQEDELTSKEWTETYVTGVVWTDNYYAHENTLPVSTTKSDNIRFRAHRRPLVDGTLFETQRPKKILYRDVRIVPMPTRFGDRILTWPYQKRLNQEYSCVYDSNSVEVCINNSPSTSTS